jgi:hypothetical protein
MREQLSIHQIFQLSCEVETIVLDFISEANSSNLQGAFERFDEDQNTANDERHFLRLDAILSVAEEVLAERRLRGSEMSKTEGVVTDDVTQEPD